MSTTFNLRDGAKIVVNNPSMVDGIAKMLKESAERDYAFHQKLLSLGVKAYRCNDGWVDRQKHIVTFFSDDKTPGWYWGNTQLQKGDLAFLGNVSNGGYFIRIGEAVSQGIAYAKYHYSIIEFPNPKDKNIMKAKLKAIWRIIRAKEWFYITKRDERNYHYDWDFMATMPKKATSIQFADLILRQSATFVQAIKLSADKIFKRYHLAGNVDEVLVDIDLRRFLTTHKVEKMVWEDGTIKEIKFTINEDKNGI